MIVAISEVVSLFVGTFLVFVIEFIKNEDFKYVRALGAFYLRLIGSSMDCYKYLEPLLNDYRKIRMQGRDGKFALSHMDEFIDELLREDRANDVILPRIQKRINELNKLIDEIFSKINKK